MARDPGLETLLAEDLGDLRGLSQKAMFGGMAWLLDGRLLCGARKKGLLLRLGKDNEAAALQLPGVTRMSMQGRSMSGWVNLDAEACADDELRRNLLRLALGFVRSLPPRE